MKILLLSQFFSTTRGGGEYVFSLIAKKLAENNHKIWILTNKISGENYEENKNIEIIFIPPTLKYQGGLPPSFMENFQYSINAIVKGLKIIKNEKIDLIHSNNFAPALAGSILSLFTSRPHITTIHDVFTLCGKDYWEKWGKQNKISKINVILAPFFERLLLKLKYDSIHTVSQATKDDLVKFGSKKPIHVIHNTIMNSSPKSSYSSNQFQFVFVGRLVFYKNLELIINAINIAKKNESKLKLIIIGDGPQRKILEELVKKLELENNVEFKGYLNTEAKTQLIATSNALLFPSLCEGFGLVILEAFAQNIPVIASNLRPMSDIITHKKTGYLLDPYDEKLWAEYILKLAKNQDEAKIIGKNGNELLKTKYNSEQTYEKIMSMYSVVLKNH